MTSLPRNPKPTLVRTCPVCERPMWQKHAEVCTGTPGRVCECPAGYQHLPGCPEVTGYGDEAA